MRSRPFASADPFLKLILLFLLSFMSLGVFMLMAQGLTSFIWGVSFFDDPTAVQDYTKGYTIGVNWVLLFFQHLGLFVVPAFLYAMLVHHQPKQVLGFAPASARSIVVAVLLIAASIPLVNALSWLNGLLAFPEWMGGIETAFQQMEEQARSLTAVLAETPDWRFLLINIVVMAALPALGEELVFRGLVLRIMESWTGSAHKAVWVSAALFSAMHLQFYGFLPRLVLGALLGYLFVWTRSIWVPIAAHFANNAVALIFMFLVARGDIAPEVDGFSPVMADFAVLAVSLVVMVALGMYLRRSFPRGLSQS